MEEEELALCPNCRRLNKLNYNVCICEKCGNQYGKCAKCNQIFHSQGVSRLCPDCRKRAARKSACMDDPLMQEAYTRTMSADTNIFTAPGKIIMGTMNVANKLSNMTEAEEEEYALKKLEKERKEAVEEAEKKEKLRLQKIRFVTLGDEEKAELNAQAIKDKNAKDCTICGILLGILVSFGTFAFTSLSWWGSILLLIVLPIPFLIFKDNRGLGYVSSALIWGIGLTLPMWWLLLLVDLFLNVYTVFYAIWPILGIALGIFVKKHPDDDIGASLLELTEEEQTLVNKAGEAAGLDFDIKC